MTATILQFSLERERKATKDKESRSCDSGYSSHYLSPSPDDILAGWNAFDEACQLVDVMPNGIVLKLMSYCREVLRG